MRDRLASQFLPPEAARENFSISAGKKPHYLFNRSTIPPPPPPTAADNASSSSSKEHLSPPGRFIKGLSRETETIIQVQQVVAPSTGAGVQKRPGKLGPVGIWGCYYATLRKPSLPPSLSFSLAVNPNKNVPLFDSTRHDIFIRIKRDRVPVPEEGVAVRCLQKTFFFPENSRSARFFLAFSRRDAIYGSAAPALAPVRRVRLIKFTLEVPRVNEIRVSMEFRVDVLLSRLSE